MLTALCQPWTIEQLVHSWKRFTARRINELLGREGALWQRDYFDRIVRDEGHFGNCVRYIRRNPEKAGLNVGACRLYESEFAQAVE
jgi:REP element-mobilizing transposase RayT